jgi:hypothetical protein
MELVGSSFSVHAASAAAAASAPAQAQPSKHHFSFGDFLDIVNPLQHLPVVGTIYRALTHDTIDTPEKLVGDALYGGPLGLLSSLADTGFQAATGRSFGDTVLSWFTGHHETTAVGTEVAKAEAPVTAAAPSQDNAAALTDSMTHNGVDPQLQQRALFAYRKTVSAFAE